RAARNRKDDSYPEAIFGTRWPARRQNRAGELSGGLDAICGVFEDFRTTLRVRTTDQRGFVQESVQADHRPPHRRGGGSDRVSRRRELPVLRERSVRNPVFATQSTRDPSG